MADRNRGIFLKDRRRKRKRKNDFKRKRNLLSSINRSKRCRFLSDKYLLN
jgi:hypothetical protein